MIQTIKNYVHGQRTLIPNTIIGGIGAYITTAAALETKLGVASGFIKLFEKRGNDLYFRVRSNYNLPINCFSSDSYITSFIDTEGFANLTTGVFKSSTVKEVVLNRALEISTNAFLSSSIEKITMETATSIASNGLDLCANLLTINAPLITSVATFGARSTTSLASTNFKPTSIGSGSLKNSSAILDVSNVTTLGNNALENGLYTTITFNSLVTTSATSPFYGFNNCVTAYFPLLETIGNSTNFWAFWNSCTLIQMRKLTSYGVTAGTGTTGSYGFAALKTGCTIEVNIAIKTANGGLPHEAFKYAKNTKGATVKFYNNDGTYNSTL